MDLEIFDVEHGACALITTDARQHVLIDCGHKAEEPVSASTILTGGLGRPPLSAAEILFGRADLRIPTGWRPSEELARRGVQSIDALIVSNLDQDHLSDLPNICAKNIFIAQIVTNNTVDMTTLRQIKAGTGGTGPGVAQLIHLLENCGHTFQPRPISGVTLAHFRVPYGRARDTNNLSLVTFVSCGGLHIIFPGDIEKPAWDFLLSDNSFVDHLRRVNVFVASHHGRERGYYSDVFRPGRCSPELVVISDKSIMHGTQENAASRYGRHASGIDLKGERRRVLTTRDDGTIKFDVATNGRATVYTAR